jgi:hypothetical protein
MLDMRGPSFLPWLKPSNERQELLGRLQDNRPMVLVQFIPFFFNGLVPFHYWVETESSRDDESSGPHGNCWCSCPQPS